VKAAADSLSNGDTKLALKHLDNIDAVLPVVLK